MSEWEKINTADMIDFGTIETRGERLGGSDLKCKRINSQVELRTIIHEREVWMKAEMTGQMLHSGKVDGSCMHLILSQSHASGENIKTSPEGNVHAALQDSPIFKAKFSLGSFQITFIEQDSTSKGFRVGGTTGTHGHGARRWRWLQAPGRAIDGIDDILCLISLVNSNAAVTRKNKVKTEKSRDLAKRMDGPMLFKYLNNLLVRLSSHTEAEKIISCMANDNGSILEDATVYGGISTIWKEFKVIKNNRIRQVPAI
jgi:hypothetical protein